MAHEASPRNLSGANQHPLHRRRQARYREYDLYLQKERSLAPATRVGYAPFVRQFLMSQFRSSKVNLSKLNARDVLKFVRRSAGQLKNKRALLMTTALRSFLRFARYRGDLTLDLAACVPPVASWSLSTLPRALPPAQVEQVLADVRQRGISRRAARLRHPVAAGSARLAWRRSLSTSCWRILIGRTAASPSGARATE